MITNAIISWALAILGWLVSQLPIIDIQSSTVPSAFWCGFAIELWGPLGTLLSIQLGMVAIYLVLWVLKRAHVLGGG